LLNRTSNERKTLNLWWINKINKTPTKTPMDNFFSDLKQIALIWLANMVGIVANILPLFQFIAVCLGILVSISTLVIRINSIKQLLKKRTP